ISPEQAHDSAAADIRSDIYSLGCTFFHMLAGDPPFPQGSLPERLNHHLKTEPPDICQLNPAVPSSFHYILQRMLAKKPVDRYQTPKELLDDLENPERLELLSSSGRLSSLADLVSAEMDQSDQEEEATLTEEEDVSPPTRRRDKLAGKKKKILKKEEEPAKEN